jgi:uncharacterized protein YhaN
MKDYKPLIYKLTEQAHKNAEYHKEWVKMEMEESGCSRKQAELRFTLAMMNNVKIKG